MTDYPKGYRENLEWRAKMLARCKEDSAYKSMIKELFYRDPVFAFNAFFYTLDVRRRPEQHQPFCTYPFQDWAIWDLYYAIQYGQDRVVEKTRDMGVSWIGVGLYTWFWSRPKESVDFLFGSRIEDYVDKKGDPRTLIEKCRYLIYRLPKWLRPAGFNQQKHDHFMKLVNPETGSTITGESNNPNFSTGGRYVSIFYDEFAKWESSDEAAWTAGGDATPCRIGVSTPFGASGKFYGLVCDSAIKKLVLHWSYHPRKADGLYCRYPRTPVEERSGKAKLRSPWYDNECKRRTANEIAQELDIDYLGSGRMVFGGQELERVQELLGMPGVVNGAYVTDDEGRLKNVPTPREEAGYLMTWSPALAGRHYVLGVDVAEGKENGDYSIVKVMDRETKSFVASLAGQIDEVNLAVWIEQIYLMYNEPWVGIETNGPGLATFDLCSLKISKLFMMPSYDSAKQSVIHTKGWRTTTASRNILISGIRDWLQERRGWVNPRTIKELTTFAYNKNGKAAAKDGCHDDEVIAMGICIQVDVLAPMEKPKKPLHNLNELGIPINMFTPKKVDIPTIEELCFQQTMEKRTGVYWQKVMESQLSMGGL